MKYGKLAVLMAAGMLCMTAPFSCTAAENEFEDEFTDEDMVVDFSDIELDEGGEIDLAEVLDDEGYSMDESGTILLDYEDETDAEIPEAEDFYWIVAHYPESDHELIMLNDVILFIPGSWKGKYDMLVREDRVDFYQTTSRAGWLMEGEEGGKLFSLHASVDDGYTEQDLPDYLDMGRGSDGFYYYLMFPTDMQAYAPNQEYTDEYTEMYSKISDVKEESFMLMADAFTEMEADLDYDQLIEENEDYEEETD